MSKQNYLIIDPCHLQFVGDYNEGGFYTQALKAANAANRMTPVHFHYTKNAFEDRLPLSFECYAGRTRDGDGWILESVLVDSGVVAIVPKSITDIHPVDPDLLTNEYMEVELSTSQSLSQELLEILEES